MKSLRLISSFCFLSVVSQMLLPSHCSALPTQREFGRGAEAQAWSPDEKSVAVLETDGVLRLVKAGSDVPVWTQRITDLNRSSATGLRQNNQVLHWLKPVNLISLSYLRQDGAIEVRLLRPRDGSTKTNFSFPQQKAKGSNPEPIYPTLRCEQNATGSKLALIYQPDAEPVGQLRVFDVKTQKWGKLMEGVNDVEWVGNALLVGRRKRRETGRYEIGSSHRGQVRPLVFEASGEEMMHWTTDGKQLLYTLSRRNDLIKNIVRCYRWRGNGVQRVWERTITTSWRQEGQQDFLKASPNGWVAVTLVYGTDGISNPRIWCLSRKTMLRPEQIMPGEASSLGMDPITWRGNSLIFWYRPIKVAATNEITDLPVQYIAFSLAARTRAQFPVPARYEAGPVAVSPSFSNYAYHVWKGRSLGLKIGNLARA
jgi:hypothetical protein